MDYLLSDGLFIIRWTIYETCEKSNKVLDRALHFISFPQLLNNTGDHLYIPVFALQKSLFY